ncbi:hypothetical protein M4L39_00650 [Staphylococcus equorum]|uniref:N-acetylmuramoyl-L-alanine amidase n=1 Tax=Staphylococcus equorum TaxID=246432 RepID=A0A9X4R0D7_9STAP|nr:hypothetical protein [Staphylococcus equorum]MDG0841933.1 hypothetical protein [Staphylococcus equorum]MDG0858015.1 hypothetical protein [Staphylococcus equorum]
MKKKSSGILFSLSVAGFIIASSNAHANTSGETNEQIHNVEQSVNKDDNIQQNITSTEDKNIPSEDTTKTNDESKNNIDAVKQNGQTSINPSDENQAQQKQNEQNITDQETQNEEQGQKINKKHTENTTDSNEYIASNHNPGNTEQEETKVIN